MSAVKYDLDLFIVKSSVLDTIKFWEKANLFNFPYRDWHLKLFHQLSSVMDFPYELEKVPFVFCLFFFFSFSNE